MRTAIFSDLHLGARSGADVARQPQVRKRLIEAAAEADRVVMLGDMLELRELPTRRIVELTRPFFVELGKALAGKRLILVPGNHDYQLAEPWLDRAKLNSGGLAAEAEWPVGPDDGLAGKLSEWLPDVDLTVAYPGLRLRPDVYATHGHYVDVHLTIPRLETMFAGVVARMTQRGRDCHSAADYEALVSPIYAFNNALAEGVSPRAVQQGGGMSRNVWSRANGVEGGPLSRFVLGKLAIPGGVAVLNRLGLGPFGRDVTGTELRRSGLRAMTAVVAGLGVEADYVIFGHTHRPGPQPADELSEWTLPGGGQLWNTGSWYYERVFLGADPKASPYWPGTYLTLEDEGPPQLGSLLLDVTLKARKR